MVEKMTINQIKAEEFVQLWAKYVNALDVPSIVGLYNEETVLLPTFSPKVVRAEEDLTQYFTNLGSKAGLAIHLDEETFNCVHIENKSYVLTGFYTFEFEVDGVLTQFPSRFTFVIDLAREKPVLQHHSSVVPTP